VSGESDVLVEALFRLERESDGDGFVERDRIRRRRIGAANEQTAGTECGGEHHGDQDDLSGRPVHRCSSNVEEKAPLVHHSKAVSSGRARLPAAYSPAEFGTGVARSHDSNRPDRSESGWGSGAGNRLSQRVGEPGRSRGARRRNEHEFPFARATTSFGDAPGQEPAEPAVTARVDEDRRPVLPSPRRSTSPRRRSISTFGNATKGVRLAIVGLRTERADGLRCAVSGRAAHGRPRTRPRRETAMSPELAGVAEFTDGTTPLGGIVDIEETRTRVFGRL